LTSPKHTCLKSYDLKHDELRKRDRQSYLIEPVQGTGPARAPPSTFLFLFDLVFKQQIQLAERSFLSPALQPEGFMPEKLEKEHRVGCCVSAPPPMGGL
jgi:hypothetical protein